MISFTVDVRELSAMAEVYADVEKKSPQVMSLALNWTGDKARTAATRALARAAGLSYGRTRQEIRTSRAQTRMLEYSIGVSGSAISLSEFGARQTGSGASAAPWGQRRIFPHTFIVAKLSGQVFKREGKSRLPIKKLWGPSLPKELVRDVVPKAFEVTATAELPARVLHELGRLFPQRDPQSIVLPK